MTPNRSLAISIKLRELMRSDFISKIDREFPYHLMGKKEDGTKNKRDRIYNEEGTLLTMLLTAIGEDKSLKQSVNIFKQSFELRSRHIMENESRRLLLEQEEDRRNMLAGRQRKRGRPKLYQSKLPKSKLGKISDNTAAYAKARIRLDKELVRSVFQYSADYKEYNGKQWHGMKTFITDGTYLQLQDTKQIREHFPLEHDGDKGFPQALLQTIIMQGSGQVCDIEIGHRKQSELELAVPLLKKLPAGSLLLADDLYCCYAIFCMVINQGVHLIVPGKRARNFKVLKTISKGDRIVELRKPARKSSWISKEQWKAMPETVTMRRITFPSPEGPGKELVQYTTLTDEQITAGEITLKYFTRWDIEITIREIKTVMGINVIRGKTEDMVFKEISVALTAYNMLRKVIAESVDNTDFSPQSHFVQECFKDHTDLLIDKKGRVYHHWSGGRYGSPENADT